MYIYIYIYERDLNPRPRLASADVLTTTPPRQPRYRAVELKALTHRHRLN